MNGDVDPSTMKMVLFYPVMFSNFAIFWRYLEGLDISKKNIWGYMGPRNYRRKSGICVAELAQQVELSGKHWISAK